MHESQPSPTVHLVTALRLEAKPLVDAWMLQQIQDGPFPVFEGELPGPRVPVRLIVAGVGRVNAAAATAWLAGITFQRSATDGIWLNYGVGGAGTLAGRDAKVGDSVVAAKVVDEEQLRAAQSTRVPTWFPPWLLKRGNPDAIGSIERTTVRTVDRPEVQYAAEGVYEMEAAGFMQTALRFSTAEFVQVMKVVSDTPTDGIEGVDRQRIRDCCEAGIGPLTQLAVALVGLAAHQPADHENALERISSGIAGKLRLTVTEERLFRRGLERLVALAGEDRAAERLEALIAEQPRKPVVALATMVDDLALAGRAQVDTDS